MGFVEESIEISLAIAQYKQQILHRVYGIIFFFIKTSASKTI